ncbi:MAG TPA: M48 family metallopeptidase, partial [Flavisolibacter sp.]
MRQIVSLLFLLPVLATAQVKPVYDFWQDDSLLKKRMLDQSMSKKDEFIAAAGKKYAKDYKSVYEDHFNSIAWLWESTRAVTQPEVHGYLQEVVQKIIAANPELKNLNARVVFTRDDWPNAVSMGDGSIAINGGLFVFMNNEAELAFAISHELAHYYLDHSNKRIRKIVEEYNSEEFKQELKKLSKQEYGAIGQLEEFMKKKEFGTRRHNRENEAEADRYAFRFLKNT